MVPREEPSFGPDEREKLRDRALSGVAAAARGESPPEPSPAEPESLRELRDAFVTVTVDGELRGCLGSLGRREPLIDAVGRLGGEAATTDPRFPPIRSEELGGLEVEISVLSEFRPVLDVSEVEPGRHGVLVSLGEARGLLLPQVAERYGWDAETFVRRAMEKAGIPPSELPEVRIEVFEAEHF